MQTTTARPKARRRTSRMSVGPCRSCDIRTFWWCYECRQNVCRDCQGADGTIDTCSRCERHGCRFDEQTHRTVHGETCPTVR